MAIPESGPLAEYGTIGVELGVAQTNVSIRGMSQTAGFTEPDAFSEFYGYSGAGCEDIVDNYDPFGDSSGVALYQLNGNATDVSGNYNGTASNVTYGTGEFGQAGVFNGSSSVVYSSNTTEVFNNTTKQGTISFWVKFDTLSSTQNIANRWDSGGATAEESWGLWYITGSDYLQFTHRDSSNNNTLAFSNTGLFSINTWYNVSVVWNGSNISFYINGGFVNTVTNTNFNDALKTTTARLTLGATLRSNNNSTQENLNGSLDQVRIFNTALTPLEVEALYTEELCICDGTVDTLDILGDGSCIATYQLDGNANDLSGNYSGTPTNVSYGVGEFDLAGVFNGSSSKVVLPTPSIIPTNLNFSLSIWVKGISISSANFDVVYLNFNGSYFVMTVASNNAYAAFSNSSNQGYSIATTSAPLDANAWNHVVISSTGLSGNCSIYVNGSFETSGALQSTTRIITLTDGNALGTISGIIQYPFNGSIDQVRIFNKALSAGEVTTLYNETACTPKEPVDGQYQTIVAAGGGSIYVSNNFGQTFSPKISASTWQDAAVSQTGQFQTAIGYNSPLYISSDYGQTWVSKTGVITWQRVAVSDTGQYQIAGTTLNPVYKSSDYGQTWSTIAALPNLQNRGVAISGDGRYQVAQGIGSYNYVSNDYGVTWTQRGIVRDWHGVAMSKSGQYMTAVAFSSSQIYVSNDYGVTWSAKSYSTDRYLVEMDATGQYQITGDHLTKVMYASTDYGQTWSATTYPYGAVQYSGNAEYIIISDAGQQLQVSNNFGVSFTPTDSVRTWRRGGINQVY